MVIIISRDISKWWSRLTTCPYAIWGQCHPAQHRRQAVLALQLDPLSASRGYEAPDGIIICELLAIFLGGKVLLFLQYLSKQSILDFFFSLFLSLFTLPKKELKPSARTQVPSPWNTRLDVLQFHVYKLWNFKFSKIATLTIHSSISRSRSCSSALQRLTTARTRSSKSCTCWWWWWWWWWWCWWWWSWWQALCPSPQTASLHHISMCAAGRSCK